MPLELAEASARRRDAVELEHLDRNLNTLLAHYEAVDADPRKMGYLRFLVKHYAKDPHPWAACYKDNFKRFGPKTPALCLAPTTPVSTERGMVEMADLKPGDMVWSFDGEQLVLKPVLWSGCTRKSAQVCRIEIENSVSVLATPEHPFLRYNGNWADARDLRVGEFLLGPLPSGVGGGVLSTASDAVPLSFADTARTDAGEFAPEMTLGAYIRFAFLASASLDNLVSLDDFSDLLFAPGRHPGLNCSHDGNRVVSVDSPVMTNRVSVNAVFSSIRAAYSNASNTESRHEFFERLRVILRGDYAGVPASRAFDLVPAKAPFSFEEPGSVCDVLGREITKVVDSEKLIDVWDIEVADTHNFLVHDFIIAHNCGVLKDTIRQTTMWRGKGDPNHRDHGAPGVAIGEADKGAANPPWGPWMHTKLSDSMDLDEGDQVRQVDSILAQFGPIGTVTKRYQSTNLPMASDQDSVAPATVYDVDWDNGTKTYGMQAFQLRRTADDVLANGLNDEVLALIEDITSQCDPCRVMLGLDDAPHPSKTYLETLGGQR